MNSSDVINEFVGQLVVLDLISPYVYLGILTGEDSQYLILEDADAHDLRDSSTTRDQYIIEAVRHGININRTRVLVQKSQVVGISLLDDVIP
ncbi:hypothetical protein [Planctomicrobium sp. SH527]|uniref:hypothetical protein n=1 Tax=Planctomicrobium sp. SH527 TaxID=3448123 RepID=UPI003F5BB81B